MSQHCNPTQFVLFKLNFLVSFEKNISYLNHIPEEK
jgi:hypothetical protein